ncbi:DegV family protein [Macrococcus sp. DPC7161]|uniref:DegV family protein n=1 Tax=Macrococcus sp. DPC7161 TaxID=2507060 RepID=UPI00100C1934|nr:DegV family protein [Macrococcus sp. DPC7161]RXK17983.1 DegV family protein [Macrococcus sp. DPC7161]
MKVAWLTDTASGILLDEHPDIYVVPMGVMLNEVHYTDQVDITTERFYELLQQYGDGAKTTQPNFQSIQETYELIQSKGYTHVIAVHPSSALTGSFQSSTIASKEVDLVTTVIDSKIGSYPIKAMIYKGISLLETGLSYEDVVEQITKYTDDAVLFLQPKNLSQLKKSGRVSKAQSLLAGILNIQLILKFEDGKIYPIDKVRTKKKVFEGMKKHISEEINVFKPSEIAVIYAGDLEEGNQYTNWLKETYPDINIVTEILVPVAGVHTGYGTIGISWIKA